MKKVENSGLQVGNLCVKTTRFQIRHGQGYSIFETRYFDIETKLTMFVAKDDPIEIWHLNIKNVSNKSRKLSTLLT